MPQTLAEAVFALTGAHGEKPGRMLARFAGHAVVSLVWTRDGAFHLGQIAGPWRYDASAEAARVGITHVRPALWLSERFDEHDVPAGVAHTFGRGGLNFQRIHDPEAETRSAEMWIAST